MHRTIGQTLRAAREARGLTLQDVAHETRIPANRILQLEGDNFAGFGSMAYAKSFLKSYSRYLGVDAREVADGLPVPVLGGPSDYRYLTETHGPWIERHERPRRKEPLAKTGGSPIPTLVGMFTLFPHRRRSAGESSGREAQVRRQTRSESGRRPGRERRQKCRRRRQTDARLPRVSTLPGNKTEGQPGAPGNPRETVIRPAMLPSSCARTRSPEHAGASA